MGGFLEVLLLVGMNLDATYLKVLVLVLVLGIGNCESTHYRAAVVDYSPVYQLGSVNRTTALSIMNRNLDNYSDFIEQAANNSSDIILFPEDGLYGAAFYTRNEILPYLEYIPDVDPQNETEQKYVPCNFQGSELEQSPILARASCLARDSNITLVLNMGEIRYCSQATDSNCPDDSRYQYNTLVAFSSTGELVAKYHKSHLYYEPQFDEPPFPDVVWFESDFGVRFGLMICFDLMFEEPQLSLYHNHNIRNFLWSSWWVNEPPLITGTQVEVSRSFSLPSNLLASGIGLSWYNSGSGIYSLGNPVQHWYNFGYEPLSKILIADLPKDPLTSSSSFEDLTQNANQFSGARNTHTGEATPPTIETFVVTPGTTQTISSFSNDLVCTATLRVSENSLGGDELFGVYSLSGIYNSLFPAQICALLRCYDEECTTPILTTSSTFDWFELSGNFNLNRLFVMYPMAATNHSVLLDPTGYETNTPSLPNRIYSNGNVSSYNLLNAALFGLDYHEQYS